MRPLIPGPETYAQAQEQLRASLAATWDVVCLLPEEYDRALVLRALRAAARRYALPRDATEQDMASLFPDPP